MHPPLHHQPSSHSMTSSSNTHHLAALEKYLSKFELRTNRPGPWSPDTRTRTKAIEYTCVLENKQIHLKMHLQVLTNGWQMKCQRKPTNRPIRLSIRLPAFTFVRCNKYYGIRNIPRYLVGSLTSSLSEQQYSIFPATYIHPSILHICVLRACWRAWSCMPPQREYVCCEICRRGLRASEQN